MVEVLTYLVAAAVFVATFVFLKRHPDWSRGESGKPFSAPGWWRPLAIGWFALIAVFVVVAAVNNGFEPAMLLAFPILGGAFALGVVLLSVVGRHQGGR
jgi:hypothetical protein